MVSNSSSISPIMPHAAASIDLLSIVEALEGRLSLLDCTGDPSSCERSGECRTLPIWAGLDRAVSEYPRGISLADAASSRGAEYVI